MSTMCLTGLLITAIVVVLSPDSAHAWGAATHLKIAETVLLNRNLLPPSMAQVIGAYPAYFSYGNLIADLILGKRYSISFRDHSHNWQVALKMLRGAELPEMQAMLWGYLCHLAADVVAHEVFVPTKIAGVANGVIRGHSAWEIAFDADWPEPYARHTLRLADQVGDVVDPYLMGRLRETLFSHKTNRRIFHWTLRVQRYRAYDQLVRRAAARTPHVIDEETRWLYVDAALRAVWDLLRQEADAPITGFDPTGYTALKLAAQARKGDATAAKQLVAGADIEPRPEPLRAALLVPIQALGTHAFETIEYERPAIVDLTA